MLLVLLIFNLLHKNQDMICKTFSDTAEMSVITRTLIPSQTGTQGNRKVPSPREAAMRSTMFLCLSRDDRDKLHQD